jgi:hypothetical protein
MDWSPELSDFLLFIGKLGVTGAAIVVSLYAAGKYASKKLVDIYFDKMKTAHAEALKNYYGERLEAIKAEHQWKLEADKQAWASIQGKDLERLKGKIAMQIEEKRAEVGENLATMEAAFAMQSKDREAQLAYISEAVKTGLDLDSKRNVAISVHRSETYKTLWSIMKPLSQQSNQELDRINLKDALKKWYYENGNGLFLTWAAMDAYYLATKALGEEKDKIPDDFVRDAFSGLRTQMKVDMAIYTTNEAARQIGAARRQVEEGSIDPSHSL